MVKVLDVRGKCSESVSEAEARHLLKKNKAKIVAKQPFTIQYLDNKENSNMKTVIISNDLYKIPSTIKNTNVMIMSYNDFVKSAESDSGLDTIEFDTIYFDVEGLDKHIYDAIKPYITDDIINCEFFTYNSKYSFIEETVKILPGKEYVAMGMTSDFCINFGIKEDLVPSTGTIIYGSKHGCGKTILLNNIKAQLESKGFDIVSFKARYDDITEIADKIDSLSKEMMERFKLMEKAQVNNIYKVKDVHKRPIVCLIDDFDYIYMSDQYKLVDLIKSNVGTILRLGRAAGIYIIVTTNNYHTLSTDLLNNFVNKIIIGEYNASINKEFFYDDNESNIINPAYGLAVLQNGQGRFLFSIDAIKYL